MIDQRFLVNWNNKQARGYASAETNAYSSVYRSQMLSDRVRAAIKGERKLTLPGLIDIMEVAGTGDLRAHSVLQLALRIIGKPKDARLRAAVDALRAWRRAGGLRKDANRDNVYDHSDAVALMDAWWPLWIKRQFEPVLGPTAMDKLEAALEIDNPPNNHGDHLGSAYQGSWYGFVRKDLRTVLGRNVRGRYAREFCGRGRRKALPARAEALAQGRARRAALGALRRRRGLQRGRQGRRPVVLRRRAPAAHRRRHAAPDPLDQPADLPAGERDHQAGRSLTGPRRARRGRAESGLTWPGSKPPPTRS